MGGAIAVIYLGGLFVSTFVYRARAGAGVMRRLRILGPGGYGAGWLSVQIGKALVWPAVLIYWLANGKPEPAIVFDEKARRRAEQQRKTAD